MGILDEAERFYQRSKEAGEKIRSGVADEKPVLKSKFELAVEFCSGLDLRFNELAGVVEIDGLPWTDDAAQRIRLEMHKAGLRAAKEDAFVAIEMVARMNPYDPLRDYLEGLVWDKTPRLRDFLTDALGVVKDGLSQEIGTRFMISAVERALKPGCVHRMMLLLIGDEGVGKSNFVHDLAVREEWHSESLPRDLGSGRETLEAVMGRWIIESAEMVSMRRSAHEAIKSFISCRKHNARLAYGRLNTTYLPRCVIVATTNNPHPVPYEGEWTRYVPVRVVKYEADYFLGVRDQLWAEAVAMYRAGYPSWLTADMAAMLAQGREEFREEDLWQGLVLDWCLERQEFAMAEVFGPGGVDLPISQRDRKAEMRVSAILKKLGYRRVQVQRKWVYEKEQA